MLAPLRCTDEEESVCHDIPTQSLTFGILHLQPLNHLHSAGAGNWHAPLESGYV